MTRTNSGHGSWVGNSSSRLLRFCSAWLPFPFFGKSSNSSAVANVRLRDLSGLGRRNYEGLVWLCAGGAFEENLCSGIVIGIRHFALCKSAVDGNVFVVGHVTPGAGGLKAAPFDYGSPLGHRREL